MQWIYGFGTVRRTRNSWFLIADPERVEKLIIFEKYQFKPVFRIRGILGTVPKNYESGSGMDPTFISQVKFIPDPIPIQGVKKHRNPDPEH
jgi:hypothetical protein